MAARYWVGGAGNWSSTTKWSATSGGASGASVPTSVDDVIFDANSGGKFTATVDTAQTVNSITITPSSGAGVLQIALSATLTTGALTTTGTAGNNRIWFRGTTYGIAINFVVNGTVNISDCDFRDLYVIGTAAPISGTRIGDLRGCRGITFSTPKTVYWSSAAGGTWSATNWAATSGGGTSNDNFPLAQDTAVIENTGLNTSATVTLNATLPFIGTLDMSNRTNAATISISSGNVIYGNLVTGSGITYSGAQVVTFSGRNTQTITSAGKTFSGGITVDSYGGSVELADALNIGSNTLTVTNGTFDTKNYNVTAGSLSSSNTNVRTINLGSSTLTFGSSGAIVSATTITNLTFNAGTSTIVGTSNGAISTAGISFYNVSLTLTTANIEITVSGANTYNNFTVTAPSTAGLRPITFFANQIINGTLTVAGASAVRRIFLRSDTLGTTRTLTVNSLSATDCDFRDITLAGAAAGSSPTRAGDCGGNTGITFPAPKTVYWNLAGSSQWSGIGWASSSGGTPDINNFPLAQDTAVFNNAAGVTQVASGIAWNIGELNMSAQTNAMTFNINSATPIFYKSITLGTGVTLSGTQTWQLSGRGTQTITSNGITFGCPITIDCFSGTVQLADALTLTSTRTLTLLSGTFDAVTYNVTAGLVVFGFGTKTVRMGSGTWTLSGTGNVWDCFTTGLTFFKGTANIVLSDTSTTARSFLGAGLSYNKLTIGGTTGTSTLTITGNNQFTELASTKTVAHTIALGTTTQTLGAWTVTGTVGNVVTVSGTATITIAGARVSGVDYLALGTTVISATSPGEFYAGANSTGGTNAILTAAPAPVTRYWVGGTGTWDATTTTKWSATSGGAGGASVPTSADAVIFDSLSNATAYTVTCTATQLRCASLTMAGPLVGNITWAGTAPLAIHGNVSLAATGITRTYTGAITLSGSTTGKTFTTNGVTLGSSITVNGVGCGWTLGSALDMGALGFVATNGSFATSTYSFSTGAITTNNANSTTLDFGSSTVTVINAAGINFGTTANNRANLTFTSGTSQLNLSSASPTLSGNNQTFYNVSFTGLNTAGTVVLNGANTFNNFTVVGQTSAGVANVSVSANQTINGTLTLSAGTDATMRTFLRSDAIGTTRTLTCAAFSGTDADFRDITIAGAAAPVSGTRLGDCKGNSGITFDAAKTVYWNFAIGQNWGSASAVWATTSGGTPAIANFPLAQDTAVFEATGLNSAATVTVNAAYNIGTIDMSARTSNTMTLATGSTAPTIYGNWINGTGTTLSGTSTLTFAGRGSQTITSAGKTFTQAFTINTPGGSVTLQDAFLTSTNTTFIHQTGTFDLNSYSVTMVGGSGVFNTSGTSTRTLALGSATLSVSGSGTAFNATTATNLTVTGTGTISLTSASAKTFAGGGISYSGITLDQGGAGTLTITGNNTFKNITNSYSATGATTINIGTTTQTVTQFTATGTSGKVLTVQGTSASSPGTLILTSGTVTTPDYLTITGVRAYNLTDTWYAGANSTNNGSLGWYFSVGSGGVIHATTGALTGLGSSVLGLAVRFRAFDTSGALIGPGSTITGDSIRFRSFGTSGALVGPGSTITGDTNRFRAFNTTGDLTGAGSLLSGDARRYRVFDATGEIPGVTAQIVGTAAVSVTHDTAGALVGPGSALTGASVLIKLYPDPSDVREGVQYGPDGMYVGTLTVVDGQTIIRIRSITERL